MNATSSNEETVTTWADGFGVWHSRITFPFPGYGPHFTDTQWDRIRAKGRRAIKREIVQRNATRSNPTMRGYVCRIQVAHVDLDHMNRMQSVTFKEA